MKVSTTKFIINVELFKNSIKSFRQYNVNESKSEKIREINSNKYYGI